MSVKIFTMTHKKFDEPRDKMYMPLHVGRASSLDLGYLGDNTGDNISLLNCYYSELTGIYWIWKNYKSLEYVGVCHYRRYLINDLGNVFTEAEFKEILKSYDLVTTKKVKLECTYYDGYAQNHNIKDLIETGKVISEKYPEYHVEYERLVHSNETYFGNIMVTSKELFDEYASWLFDIFFEVQKRVDIDSYDEYHKRVFGFISEILLLVWVSVKKLKAFECTVGMTVEKIETKEMKEKLASYFKNKDIVGAKAYFTESLNKRPDVLMEASDITGELKLAMQVTATSDVEYTRTGRSILDSIDEFAELMNYFKNLNRIVEWYCHKNPEGKSQENSQENLEENLRFLMEDKVSDSAIEIAAILICTDQKSAEEVMRRIMLDREDKKTPKKK